MGTGPNPNLSFSASYASKNHIISDDGFLRFRKSCFSFASDFRVVAFLFVKMSQRESRSMSCVRNRRLSCWTSSRISRRSFPSSASPRSPAVHPTSSPRCTLSHSLSGFIFERQSLCFWYCCFFFWVIQKGGEAVDCTGVDGDIAEAEGGSEGSLQEEEVPASRSASQEDQGHSEKAYQAPGIYRCLCFDIVSS